MVDERFVLVRDTGAGVELWHAALVESKSGAGYNFRLSWPGRTKDRFGQADEPTALEDAAMHVISHGARIRWRSEQTGQSNSLNLKSAGVLGYRLDASVAAKCGVPAATA